jgi:hypothetical protein
MREETRRRLNRAIWRDRLKLVAGLAIAAAALIAAFAFMDFDASVENLRVPGIVEHIGVLNSKDASRAVTVDVELDDGRHVTVIALKTTDPHVGAHVLVSEHRHRTGRVTFTWK